MPKFLYELVLSGSNSKKLDFCRELVKLKYKPSVAFSDDGTPNVYEYDIGTGGYSSQFDFYVKQGGYSGCTIDHIKLNLNNKDEYKCALSLAAVIDDNNAHTGELWRYGYSIYEFTSVISNSDLRLTGKGSVHYIVDQHYDLDVTSSSSWNKLTADEILEFYNIKNAKQMAKTVSGFQLISAVGSYPSGTKVYISPSFPQDKECPYIDVEFKETANEVTIGECKRYPEFWKSFTDTIEDKPKSVEVIVGKPRRTIVISAGDDNLRIKGNDYRLSAGSAYSILNRIQYPEIGTSIHCLSWQIGCASDGLIVTRDEIEEVLRQWRKLNPGKSL